MRTSTRKTRKSSHFAPYFIKRLSSWLVLSTVLTLAPDTRAAIISWDGEAGDSLWGSAANWFDSTNTVNDIAPGAADTVVFGIAGPTTIDLGANQTVNAVSFTASGFAVGLAATSNQLAITTGVVTVTANGTINAVVASAAGLTLGSTSTSTLTLTADNSLTLTGTIAVNAGTLSIGADNNLGAGANAITLGSGTAAGTLQATFSFASSRGVTLDATNGGKIDVTGSNVFTLNGTIAATAGSLTKTGTGTLTLGAANSYAGITSVENGILSISSSGNLGDASATNTISLSGGGRLANTGAAVDLGATRNIAIGTGGGALSSATATVLTISGALSGGNALGVTGGGTLVFTGNNSGFSGNLNVDSLGGTSNTVLQLTTNNSLTGGTVTLAQGTVAGGTGTALDLTGVTMTGVNLVMNSNAGSNFRSALTTSAGANVWNGNITLNGDGLDQLNTSGAGSSLTVNGNVLDGGAFTGSLLLRGVGTGTIAGAITLPTGNISKTDGGTWNINTTGNSWLNTQVSVGTLRIGIADAIPTTSPLLLGQNDANTAVFDLNGFNQTVGSIATNPTAAGVNTNTKSITNSSLTPVVFTVNTATSNTYSGFMSGLMDLVKTGAGTTILNGATASTFTGAIGVTGGTLDFTADNLLGDINNDLTISNNATLSYSSGTADWDPAATRTINIAPTGAIFGGTRAIRITDAGQIVGSGTITRAGTGATNMLDFNSANTGFTGNLIVSSAVAEVRNVQGIGTGVGQTVTINGGEFSLAGGTQGITLPHAITANGGRMSFHNFNGASYSGPVTVGGNFTIGVKDFYQNTNRAGSISGAISGTGIITVSGTPTGVPANTSAFGSVLLSANNTGFTGSFRVDPGAHLRAVQGATLDALSAAPITLNGGTLGISPELTAAAATAGLSGRYYSNATLITNGVIGGFDFGVLTPTATRTDTTINFPDLGVAGRPAGVGANNWGALWTGILNITTPGNYNFLPSSDDGSLIYVDGQQIAQNDASQAVVTRAGSIQLTAGFHSVIIKYGQGGGGSTMIVNYNGPDTGNINALLGSVANSLTTDTTTPLIAASTSIDNNITLATGTTSGIDLSATNVTLTGSLVYQGTGTGLTITGVTGSETFTPTGAVTLNGVNTITTGVVQVAGNTQFASAGADVNIGVNITEGTVGSSLIKAGPRTLTLTGSNGWTGGTTVNGGLLRLNSGTANTAIGTGNLTILSNTGAFAGVDNAVVRLLASNQIADTATVTITTTGSLGARLDLNGFSDTIGALNMTTTTNNVASISTGATGTLTLGGNVTLNANRNATGNTGREIVITGNTNAATISGTVTPGVGTLDLGGATRTITVATTTVAPNDAGSDATIETIITNGGIIKAGSQRLILQGSNPAVGANSTFAGGITINAGAIRGIGANATTSSVFGTGTITLNTGTLTQTGALGTIELRNNGGVAPVNIGQGGTAGTLTAAQLLNNTITYGNNVTVAAAVPTFSIDVNNNGANTANTMVMGTLTTGAAAQINVTGGNSYSLRFNGISLGGTLTANLTTANLRLDNLSGANNITTLGTGTLLLGGTAAGFTGTVTSTTGGTRLVPVVGGGGTTLGGGALVLAANPTVGISPTVAGGTLAAGTAGGLTARFYQVGNTSMVLNTAVAFASIPSGVTTVSQPTDSGIVNRPPTITATSFTGGVVVLTGLLEVLTGGSYTFQTFADDQSQLVIDGTPLISVNTGGGGTGILHSPVSNAITLGAGLHTITMKVVNNGGGGGYGLLYNGADSGGVMRPIASARLQSTGLLTNIANSGLDQTIAAAASLTLDGGGTDLDGGINNLTFSGATGTLNVTNVAGTGIMTVSGTTAVGANTATLNPTTGILGLIGDVTGGGIINKTGAGTVILRGAKTFTGAINVTVGGVQVTNPASLGTAAGATVVSSGAVLDLNGVALGAEPLNLNGAGIALIAPAALWNSASGASSASGAITLAGATTVGGLGDMSLTGGITGAFNLTKIGPNTLTVTTLNNTGTATVTSGFLKQGGAGAIGALVTSVVTGAGGVFDLNGFSLARPLSLNGAGTTNYGTINSLGTLVNTGASGAIVSGAVTMTANSSVGSSSLAAGGDFTISGIIGGLFALTKVGGNTVTVTENAAYTLGTTINLGGIILSGANGRIDDGGMTINPTATLTLDNTVTAASNRISARAVNLVGGNYTINGFNGATAVVEAMAANTLTFTSNTGVVSVVPNLTLGTNGGVQITTSNTITRATNATGLIRGNNLGNAPGNNVANVVSSNATVLNTIGQGGGAGSSNRAIAPWLLADQSSSGVGTSFAAHVGTNGIQVLAAADYATANSVAASANLLLNAGATTGAPVAQTMVNSLTFDANANLTIGAGATLAIDSGGFLARTGTTSTISGAGNLNALNIPYVAFSLIPTIGNGMGVTLRETIVQTPGTGILNINMPIGNVNTLLNSNLGLTKAGAGDLSLGANNFFTGSVRINGGRVLLASGAENTLLFPVTAPAIPGVNASTLNVGNIVGNAGTLDLMGKDQRVGGLASNLAAGSSALPGTGGIITNSVAGPANTATLRISQGATFPVSTALQGNLNVQRDGGFTLTMTSPNTHTGTTVINGGLTILQDGATFGSTSALTINRAALRLVEDQTLTVANRLPTTIPITLNGGALGFVGRGGGTQNVWNVGTGIGGSVTIGAGTGMSLFQGQMAGNANANGAGDARINIGNLIRGGAGSQVSFNFIQAGSQDMGDNPRFFISELNGGALTPTVVLPAWITVAGVNPASAAGGTSGTVGNIAVNSLDFAQYDATTGLRPVFYTSTIALGNNVNLTANTTLGAGGATINNLRLDGASTITFTAPTDVLNLQSGGFISPINANTRVIGSAADSGRLTAGGVNPGTAQELYIYNTSANTLTINSKIVNNPTDGSVVSVNFSSANIGGGRIQLNGANTYGGTTYVNGAILDLAAAGGVSIPGNLILNGGSANGGDSQSVANQTTRLLASNQIATTANITLNGGTLLDLNGFSNTVNNLTFAADGGSNGNQGASIQTGVGTLTLNGDLTATILNQATTIPGMQGNLSLPAGTHTFNIGTVVGAPGQVGFQLNSSLAGTGGITKTGNGILGLAGSTSGGYVGTISVNTGSIQFTQNAATASFTLANPINLSGAAINLGGTGTLNAGGFIGTVGTLTGTGTVTSTVGTLNVTSQILNNFTVVPQVNVGGDNGIGSFGGLLTGGVILGKVGTGNQTLTNGGSTYTAGTVVNGGILTLGGGAGVNVTGTGLLSVNNTGTLAGVGGATGGIQFNSGSAANFALGAPAGPAPLTPATVNSGGAATFNITGTTGVGTYSLIDYAGTAITAGQMAGMKLGTTPGGGFLYGLVNNAANTSIDLSVQAVAASKTWSGATNGTWNTVTNNFTIYNEGEQVVFANGPVNRTITGATRTPQAITFNNSVGNDYSVANDIGGALAGGLTKTSSGVARLTGNNTFGGAISLTGGTLRANVSSASNSLGSGSVALGNGTTLTLDPTANTSTSGLTGRLVTGGLNSGGTTTNNYYGQTAAFTGTFFTTGTNNITGGTAPFFANGLQNNFGGQFTGKIKIDAAGPYSFTARSDDGSRVFIDGVLVVGGDGAKGTFGAGGHVMLSKGLHDIRIDYGQGVGGDDLQVQWQGPGIAKAVIPAANIFTAETVTSTGSSTLVNAGTNLSVSGSATLNLNGTAFTGVQFGSLTTPAASTLTVLGETGKMARMAGTFLNGGTVTLNSAADIALGQVTDGGVATTLVKQGAGRLVLDNTDFGITGRASSLVAGTIIEVQGGRLVAQGYIGGANPLSSAQVRLNGGALQLDTKQGNVTFDTAVTVAQSGLLEIVPSAQTQTLGSATTGVLLQSGSTLTVDLFGGARNQVTPGQFAPISANGAALTVAGAITGSGNLVLRSTQFDQGMYPVYGSATFTANNSYAGTMSITGGLGAQNVVVTMPLTLNGQGRLSGTTGITLNAAQLTLDNNATVNTGRINATTAAPLTMRSGNLNIFVSTGANSGETLAGITSDVGVNRIVLQNTPGAGLTGLLTGASLTRNNRSVVQFVGSSLGGAATAASLVKFTTAPALVGLTNAQGGAGTATISILPYAFGASNPGNNPPTYMPVTYDATNGIRPINTTTEVTSLALAVTSANVRSAIGAATLTPGPTTVGTLLNSYVLDNSAATAQTLTLDTNVLNFSGGAGLLMFTATNGTQSALTIASGLAGNGINFGTSEGNIIVSTTAGATIGTVLSGSNGITVTGNNNVNSNNMVGALWGGTLTLTANNSAGLTGTITINGRLVISNAAGTGDTPLGNAANPIQFGGGTLVFGLTGSTLAATRTVTLLADSFGVIDTNTFPEAIAGVVTGSGGLIKVNTGRLTLNNTGNNYSGPTTILQGDLTTNTGPQGNIFISGQIDNGTPASATPSNVTFTQAASGTYTGNITGVGSLTINVVVPGQTITLGDPTNANVGVNNYGGGTTIASVSTTLRGTTSSLVGGIVMSDATDSVIYEQIFNGEARTVVSGGGPVLKLGTGAVTLINNATYTGTTTVSAGAFIAGIDSLNATTGAFGNAASAVILGDALTTTNNSSPGVFTGGAVTIGRAITVANQATTGVYRIGGAADALSTISGAISLNQAVTISQVATTLTNSLNITGGISAASAGAKTVTFSGPGPINVATTAIANGAGTVAVSVTAGTNAFNVANTYGGATAVSGGTLLAGVAGALPTTTDLSLTGGTVDLNNAALASSSSQTVNSLAGTGGTITNTDATTARTLTDNQASTTAYSGLLAGNLALTKSGAGTLALSAVNTYTGGTAITGGILNVNANAALGALAGGVAISNDGTLQAASTITSNRTFTLSTLAGGNIDTNGQTVTLDTGSTVTGTALEKTGAGTLAIKGVQTYSSLTTTGGVTDIYTALGTGTSTITANATLNIYASQTLASLDIGAGTEVTFGDGLPFAGGGGKVGGFTASFTPPAGGAAIGGSAVVPEPGSVGLLLVGALGLLARRRRQ